MTITRTFILLSTMPMGLMMSPACFAKEPDPGLSGVASFGFSDTRGNTDARGIHARARFEHVTDGPWRHDGNFVFVTREEGGRRAEERYEARATANYFWGKQDYVFGRVEWRKNHFGGVREEWLPSLGYGRTILDDGRHDLLAEIGGGYRFAELSDGTTEYGGAISLGLRYRWEISPSAQFFQDTQLQWSRDNTFVESETGIRTTIIGNLNARLSYTVRRNSEVPEDTRNSDFFTQIGLEYEF